MRTRLLIVTALAVMAGLFTTGNASAVHPKWQVIPVVFYGNNETYDGTWPTLVDQRLAQVRAWYKSASGGKTFTIAPTLTIQATHSWQWYIDESRHPGLTNCSGTFPHENVAESIFHDIRNRGEPIYRFDTNCYPQEQATYDGYIYIVFAAFNTPFQGAGISGQNGYWAGHALVGDVLFTRDQQPNDCLTERNCPYTTLFGGDAHELGHAFDINPHEDCPVGGPACLGDGQHGLFPVVSLLADQIAKINSSPFFTSNSGAIPATPTNVWLPNTGGYLVDPCYTDNATNEQQYYMDMEQYNGSSYTTREYQMYRHDPWAGTGDHCHYGVAWYSQYSGETAQYHMKVYAQGPGGNTPKVDATNIFWYTAPMMFRPNAPTGIQVTALGGGGAQVCWWDQSNSESGYMLEEWQDLPEPPNGPGDAWQVTYWLPPVTATAPSWTCKNTDVPMTGNYYFKLWATALGASSSTTNPSAAPSLQPVALTTSIITAHPTPNN